MQVDLECGMPAMLVVADAHARVVDEDVYAAEPVGQLDEHVPDRIGGPHVERHSLRSAHRLDLAGMADIQVPDSRGSRPP